MLPGYSLVALALLLVAELLLFVRVSVVRDYFYVLAWWPYIVAADGLIYSQSGRSPFIKRPAVLFFLSVWSVTFWLVFEVLNFRLDNWHYVNLVSERCLRWPGYALSFGTVLPGLFVTCMVLKSLGVAENLRTKPFAWTPLLEKVSVATGILFIILPMLWPKYCFPLVWGAFFLLFDPLNARLGGSSLIIELSRGRPRRIARLLIAGLVCGLLWEFWNYWAGAKWQYTIPIVGGLKLFEMPVLGFLGFPPFALECYAMYAFAAAMGLAPGWEQLRRPTAVSARIMTAFALQLAFWLWAFAEMDQHTVLSFH